MVSGRSPLAALKAIRRLRTLSQKSSSFRTRSRVKAHRGAGVVETTIELAGVENTGAMAEVGEAMEAMVVGALLSRGNWMKPAHCSTSTSALIPTARGDIPAIMWRMGDCAGLIIETQNTNSYLY